MTYINQNKGMDTSIKINKANSYLNEKLLLPKYQLGKIIHLYNPNFNEKADEEMSQCCLHLHAFL